MRQALAKAPTRPGPRRSTLDRGTAMCLAATEYERFVTAAARLGDDDWSRATANVGWTVRDMVGHTLGMTRMAASLLEQRSQTREAGRRGGVWIDALTAVQVERTASLSTAELVAQLVRTGRKAARARRRAPALVRRRTLPIPQVPSPEGPPEDWTIGYLLDEILTRDPWMHRSDLAVATGQSMELTADHDGVLVAHAVTEWAHRHGRPYALTLTGPAGGSWSSGAGGRGVRVGRSHLLSGAFRPVRRRHRPDRAARDPRPLLSRTGPRERRA